MVRELDRTVQGTGNKMSSHWTRPAVSGKSSFGGQRLSWKYGLLVLLVEGSRRHVISVSPAECGRGNALGPPNSAFSDPVVFILSLEKQNRCVKKLRLAH